MQGSITATSFLNLKFIIFNSKTCLFPDKTKDEHYLKNKIKYAVLAKIPRGPSMHYIFLVKNKKIQVTLICVQSQVFQVFSNCDLKFN